MKSYRMRACARFYLHASKPLAVIRLLLTSLVFISQFLWLPDARGQEVESKNPYAQDPATLRKGGSTFRANCGFCHGNDALGENGAPDLTSPRTQRRSDAELRGIILGGRSGTEMPANDLSEKETAEVVAYLRSLRSNSNATIAGDPKTGRKIYFEKVQCSACHMINGNGGRLGPDLSRIGASRSTAFIVESIRQPSKVLAIAMMSATAHETPVRYQTITVVTNDGQRITGVRKNEDTFSVQLLTQGEELRVFLKKDLKEVIHEQRSLMPAYSEEMLSTKDLQDLLAFMEGLNGR